MNVCILSAVRTPVGKFLGGLSEVPAVRLAAGLIPEALLRAGVMPSRIDEAIFGNVIQAGGGDWGSYSNCPAVATSDSINERIGRFYQWMESGVYGIYGAPR